MTDISLLLPALPRELDGVRVEIDPAHERGVIVLRAMGDFFSSGGETGGFLEASPEHVSRLAWNIAAPARCSKPIVAVNRGYCFGVGFELSLACDFRLAFETCLYALPEQRLAQIPGSGGAARLQKMVGISRAKDIVMRSRRITGREASDWGIATVFTRDGEFEATADRLSTSSEPLLRSHKAAPKKIAQRYRGRPAVACHRTRRPVLRPATQLRGFSAKGSKPSPPNACRIFAEDDARVSPAALCSACGAAIEHRQPAQDIYRLN
jgi:enoyl-CoA hydratase/carnithine racemase